MVERTPAPEPEEICRGAFLGCVECGAGAMWRYGRSPCAAAASLCITVAVSISSRDGPRTRPHADNRARSAPLACWNISSRLLSATQPARMRQTCRSSVAEKRSTCAHEGPYALSWFWMRVYRPQDTGCVIRRSGSPNSPLARGRHPQLRSCGQRRTSVPHIARW